MTPPPDRRAGGRGAGVEVAVVPAAGFGTRFLPATKAIPKEMLPIVSRPALQVIAEEAAGSGIRDLVVITGRHKANIVDHFDRHPELERVLEESGKDDLLRQVLETSRLVNLMTTRQQEALGLGHAVLKARSVVGERPFAVILPDDLILSETPFLRHLLDAFERTGKGAVALMEVPEEHVSRYGIVRAKSLDDGTWEISDMVEKPSPKEAPSNLAIVGRYVLPNVVFDYIEETPPGRLGEIQLTDALRRLARTEGMIGVPLTGQRHDTGNVVGFIAANVAYGLKDPQRGPALREALKRIL
jgi:UTP--glucose-1-phosphate uridylyltransferase